jgi:hypothetical protein
MVAGVSRSFGPGVQNELANCRGQLACWIRLTEGIRSLSDSKRDTTAALDHLRKSRCPMVLTVNVRAEANAGIRRGLEAVAKGRVKPLREAIDSIKAQRAVAAKRKRAAISG